MSETNIIRHIPPCSSCDLEALESWLSDLAREGHYLKEVGRYSWHFRKGQPREVPYRLIPGRRKPGVGAFFGTNSDKLPDEPSQSSLERFAAMGWEYVDRHGHFFIFRGTESFDGLIRVEPRIRPEELTFAIQHEGRQLPFILLSLLVILPGFLYGVTNWGKPLLFLSEFLWVLVSILLITLVYLLHHGMHLCQLRRLRRKLEDGFWLDHKKEWKKTAVRNRVGKVLFILFVTFWSFALSLLDHGDPNYHLLSDYPGDPPFPVAAELEPAIEFLSHDGLYCETSTLLIPVHIEWWENSMVEPRHEIYYRVDYYETLTPAMAHELAKELWYQEEKEFHYRAEGLPNLGLDYAVVYDQEEKVILQEGNKVMQATLDQEVHQYISLEVWTAQLADSLRSGITE